MAIPTEEYMKGAKMNKEMQRRKTFEIVAKWISRNSGVKITLAPGANPQASQERKEIILPTELKEENLDSIIAVVNHEAMHIQHSTFDPKQLVTTQEEFNILNMVEDIRIDKMGHHYLPNSRYFYDQLAEWEYNSRPKEPNGKAKLMPPERQVIYDYIQQHTGYSKYMSGTTTPKLREITPEAQALEYELRLLESGRSNYSKAKKLISDITTKIFGKTRTSMQPSQITMVGNGKIGKSGQKNGQGVGVGLKPCEGKGDKPGGAGCGDSPLFTIDPTAKVPLDGVSYDEQTQQAFKELLVVAERKIVREPRTLDTENLTSFAIGDLETLFKDDKKEKQRKSKILFLLDSSGSMHSNSGLYSNVSKHIILANVVRNITKVLDDVKETDGLNVDYDVRAFDTRYIELSKDNWYEDYIQRGGGGTLADMAFEMASKELGSDRSIDGRKMIVFVTDGDVGQEQLEHIKEWLNKNGTDIRAMILGIGMNSVSETELGASNILSEQLADSVLMNAIEAMLD